MTRQVPHAERFSRTERFIRENLNIAASPLVPEVMLHVAHPGSGLRRLTEASSGAPPYWAYHWAGGTVLARHLLDTREIVRGRRVLDLGAGSGMVGIAAALAGAARVTASEIDPHAIAAIKLNAALNGVAVDTLADDLLDGLPPSGIDLVAVGDLFYSKRLATRAAAYLGRCRAAGIEVLVGDPGRAFLPRGRLRPVADLAVPDFGEPGERMPARSTVYAFDDPEGAAEQCGGGRARRAETC